LGEIRKQFLSSKYVNDNKIFRLFNDGNKLKDLYYATAHPIRIGY